MGSETGTERGSSNGMIDGNKYGNIEDLSLGGALVPESETEIDYSDGISVRNVVKKLEGYSLGG